MKFKLDENIGDRGQDLLCQTGTVHIDPEEPEP